jgi:hypothetical protein
MLPEESSISKMVVGLSASWARAGVTVVKLNNKTRDVAPQKNPRHIFMVASTARLDSNEV